MYQSQIGQDMFVLTTLSNKREGTFVDIGAGHPVLINNTYVLEDEYGWSGLSVDFGNGKAHKCAGMTNQDYKHFWDIHRKSPLLIGDALTINYKKTFLDMNMPTIMDYLDIDIEPPEHSLKSLFRVMESGFKFRVITFEHDEYRGTSTKKPAREFLETLGYLYVESKKPDQEDWYVLDRIY